jgi:HD-GYP domain-containing protein (c-di-GMP phosphodiesterase class II)
MLKRQPSLANMTANLLSFPWKNQSAIGLPQSTTLEERIDFSSQVLINMVLQFLTQAMGAKECQLELIPSRLHHGLFPSQNTFFLTFKAEESQNDSIGANKMEIFIEDDIPNNGVAILGKLRFNAYQVLPQAQRQNLILLATPFFYQLYQILFLQASPFLLKRAYLQMLFRISNMLDKNNQSMYLHAIHTANLAKHIAGAYGCTSEQSEGIYFAGMLHDIGKILIPDEILYKSSPLSEAEWEQIKMHPVNSAIFIEPLEDFNQILPMARHHHEWFDGSGYPDHLSGEQISLGARILSLADAYGTMIDGRIYRAKRSPEDAREEVLRYKGSQFDPRIVEAFLSILPCSS